jgi:Cft2 family RNA processing exonuclease
MVAKSKSNSKHQDNSDNKNALSKVPPIYATFPTVKMGQMTLYDQHAAVSLDGSVPSYSLQDLDQVFSTIVSIKYSQYVTVHHPITGQAVVTVTAHRAGHCVGGLLRTATTHGRNRRRPHQYLPYCQRIAFG